jgi:hypothetical protein
MDCEEPHVPTEQLVVDNDSNSSRTSLKESGTFLSKGLGDFYIPIDKYEGRHRYDPDFRWRDDEEKSLVRKVSWQLCSWKGC